jgi:hypothetical protein
LLKRSSDISGKTSVSLIQNTTNIFSSNTSSFTSSSSESGVFDMSSNQPSPQQSPFTHPFRPVSSTPSSSSSSNSSNTHLSNVILPGNGHTLVSNRRKFLFPNPPFSEVISNISQSFQQLPPENAMIIYISADSDPNYIYGDSFSSFYQHICEIHQKYPLIKKNLSSCSSPQPTKLINFSNVDQNTSPPLLLNNILIPLKKTIFISNHLM